jgi:putative membrane protein
MMGYGYGYPMMGYEGYGIVHALFSVFSIVIFVVAVVTLVRWFSHGEKSKMRLHDLVGGESALDILKKRYAKGEIDRKEFEEKKVDLKD